MSNLPNIHTKVLVATDSFKGSATSLDAGNLIAEGVRRACPQADVRVVPIADGGEGTVDALLAAKGGELRTLQVSGPLGGSIEVSYGILADGSAVIEAASAVGIGLSSLNEYDAVHASSFGLGEMILDALDHGSGRIFVGLGGSGTSDGGAGLAQALGARLLSLEGRDIEAGLVGLRDVVRVDLSQLDFRLKVTDMVLLTDVTNPLYGLDGAIHVYGPQKGLPTDALATFDSWMVRYAHAMAQALGTDKARIHGAGAAGGLGFCLAALCGAQPTRGIEAVLDAIDFDRRLRNIDLVITGEGRMDAQTASGKAPVGVARRARARSIPVVAVVGSRADDVGAVWGQGIDLVIPAITAPMTLDEACARTAVALPLAGETAMRAYLLSRR